MPLHKASTALVVALAMAMVLGACSRLSFVRPDVSRGDYTQTAPVIEVTDGDRVPVLALRDRLLLAQHRLQAGKLDEAREHAEAVLERRRLYAFDSWIHVPVFDRNVPFLDVKMRANERVAARTGALARRCGR